MKLDLDRLVICADKAVKLMKLAGELSDLDKHIDYYDLTEMTYQHNHDIAPDITVPVETVRYKFIHQIRDIEHYLRSCGVEIPENDYALVRE